MPSSIANSSLSFQSSKLTQYRFSDLVKLKKNSVSPSSVPSSFCLELDSIESGTGKLLKKYLAEGLKSQKNTFKKGDVLYSKLRPYLKKYYRAEFDGLCSSEFWVFEPKNIDDNYLYFILQTDRFNKLVNIQSGSKMPRANWKTVSQGHFYLPQLEEQQKIGSFLSSVDEWIENLSKQKEQLEQYKKGMMQKIFSQEVRFKDEDGRDFPDWEEYNLGALFEEQTEKPENDTHQLLSVSIKKGVTKFDNSLKKDSSNNDKSKYKIVNIGDIAYNTMRMWQGASGVSNFKGIVSPAYTVVRLKKGSVQFFSYLFKQKRLIYDFYRYSQGLTSDTWNLKFRHFSEVRVIVPNSNLEQEKISDYLSALDELIQSKGIIVKKAKEWKKGLLQKMFV